ncbi:MAG: hypothetical protein KA314_20705 [Chloroflexi bacterium]|nr:hypothetical protein [Chloroflexota bacterium]MBP8058259.1 hypothetical protein [Chloroflexota bacterium]
MNQPTPKERRLIVLFLLGVLLLNFPIMALFSRETLLAGVPVLYWYLLGVWGGLIGLMVWVVERRK